MEATSERFAYRCLPLSIANAHGWEILCPSGFVASWNGKPELEGIGMLADPGAPCPAVSHFGSGILTFHIPCLFRTEPGYDLLVQGPVNRPKHGIAALSGVIETDWSPYTFTMNWIFTRPDTAVRFEKGEPFCHLFPVERGALEEVEPELRRLSDAPELKRSYEAWTENRNRFNADLSLPGSEARAEKWQKLYHRGLNPDGESGTAPDHRTRLRLKPFCKI